MNRWRALLMSAATCERIMRDLTDGERGCAAPSEHLVHDWPSIGCYAVMFLVALFLYIMLGGAQ